VRLSWNDWTTHAPTIGGGLNQQLEERYEAFFDGFLPAERRSRIRGQR
jgi:hypothetical protein